MIKLSTPQSLHSMAQLRNGDHVACLYRASRQRTRVMDLFFQQARQRNERVLFFGSATEALEFWPEGTRQDVIGADKPVQVVSNHDLRLGRDSAKLRERVMGIIRDHMAKARQDGLAGVCIVAEWEVYLGPWTEPVDLQDLDNELDELIRREGCIMLCLYSERLPPAVLLTVLRTHPFVSVGTRFYENFFYIPSSALAGADRLRSRCRYQLKTLVSRGRAESEEHFLSEILKHSEHPVIVRNLRGQILAWSRGAEKLYGYSNQEARRSGAALIIPEGERQQVVKLLEAAGDKEPVHEFDTQRRTKDGRLLPVHVSAALLLDEEGRPRAIATTEYVQSQTQLDESRRRSESEGRYNRLIENINEFVYTISFDEKGNPLLTAQSPKCRDVTGYAQEDYDSNPRLWFNMIYKDDQKIVAEFLAKVREQKGPLSLEHRIVSRTGVLRWVRNTCSVREFMANDKLEGCVLDITQRKLAEEARDNMELQMRQAQRYESLGLLSGGIAHDLNNLLTVILGNAGLILMDMPEQQSEDGFYASVKQVEDAALKASQLVTQILAYSGRAKAAVETLDLSRVLSEMQSQLQGLIPADVKLRFKLAADLSEIETDRVQIRQLLTNLISNAVESFRGQPGEVTIATGMINVDAAYLARCRCKANPLPGWYVWLEITDTGPGMDAGTVSRIFDPYFTTKLAGRGLGLAVVDEVMRKHRGAVRVTSQVGLGTTVQVLFPPSLGAVAKAVPAKAAPPGALVVELKSALVVDDEESIRFMAQKCLQRVGVTVMTAGDGIEALAVYQAHLEEIGVVLLDMTMPRMDGIEAIQEIRKINPDAKVVLSSGYSDEDISGRLAGIHLSGFLQKPYQPEELCQLICKLLGKPPEA